MHRSARAALALTLVCASPAAGEPETRPWWPSVWGADDQIGAANRLAPVKALEAAALITSGAVYDMGRVFEDGMPLFALTPHHRKYTLFTFGVPHLGPMGSNALLWNEDYISGHLAQSGSQFDALAHMATALGDPSDLSSIRYYNGLQHSEIGGDHGFSKLGVERVPPFFTPGLLLDLRGLRGRRLERSEEISVDDLRAALARQGLRESDLRAGDALFYHTGWGELWGVDNDAFNAGTPGLSPEAGDWVVERGVVLVGTDNWGVEAIPQPEGSPLFAPNHQKFLVEHGIYILENLDFSALIEAEVWRFAFSFAPLKLKGATGSPARPFAVR